VGGQQVAADMAAVDQPPANPRTVEEWAIPWPRCHRIEPNHRDVHHSASSIGILPYAGNREMNKTNRRAIRQAAAHVNRQTG
jgi:hypothetical protein